MSRSSDFWYTDYETYMYWQCSWDTSKLISYLEKETESFLSRYLDIAGRFQMLLPTVIFYSDGLNDTEVIFNHLSLTEAVGNKGNSQSPKFPLLELYNLDQIKTGVYKLGADIFPSNLYVYGQEDNIIKKPITDINELKTVKDEKPFGCPPIGLSQSIGKDCLNLILSIGSDCFYPRLFSHNRRVKHYRKKEGKFSENTFDNSELCYLNTPRLNSFLRDFTELCLEFGATTSFENFLDDDPERPEYLNKNGVLMDGEIIYYEDVMDIIHDKYKV